MTRTQIPAQSNNSSSPLHPHVAEVRKHNIILSFFSSRFEQMSFLWTRKSCAVGNLKCSVLSAATVRKTQMFVCLFVRGYCRCLVFQHSWQQLSPSEVRKVTRSAVLPEDCCPVPCWGGRYPVRETSTRVDITLLHSKYTYRRVWKQAPGLTRCLR